ncbi:MAG: bL28 family ribosomal protein [Chloroflexota bacterium]|nr:bL28 family ribosomal protein [Chloroflexota bacterium]MXW24672.1 mitochondrial large ribosomal subunit protein bL28m [Chloroflexota bacterium]MXZ47094.1 mitochondrial large ribosomal subunit protein bL28m [Chloroflexota bacterium]MXZ63678.1 mitochondrial large ribosomal subunit protein bL28m [Chloroflexota bacterium]MYE33160.1 mitochondrial large ribosomal subunit protein bL28m [Chloroflexota bacterium]
MASGKCDLCPKRTKFGRNIRHKHSGRWERKAPRTNREFRPNVQSKRLFIDGRMRRVNVCTRCLRTQLKRMAEGKPAIPEGALADA